MDVVSHVPVPPVPATAPLTSNVRFACACAGCARARTTNNAAAQQRMLTGPHEAMSHKVALEAVTMNNDQRGLLWPASAISTWLRTSGRDSFLVPRSRRGHQRLDRAERLGEIAVDAGVDSFNRAQLRGITSWPPAWMSDPTERGVAGHSTIDRGRTSESPIDGPFALQESFLSREPIRGSRRRPQIHASVSPSSCTVTRSQ